MWNKIISYEAALSNKNVEFEKLWNTCSVD